MLCCGIECPKCGTSFTVEASQPAPTQQPLTAADVRRAGGIVHSDGNVFFTNLDMLNKAITGSKT